MSAAIRAELTEEVPARLWAHWQHWLGATREELRHLGSPARDRVVVVGTDVRLAPAWDGEPRLVVGVVDPWGNAVVSVPTGLQAWGRALLAGGGDLDELTAVLPAKLGLDNHTIHSGVYRWNVDPPSVEQLPDAGVWLPPEDPRLPEWLRPFGGPALVALEDDRYLAGVGLKRHDSYVHEIAVGTDEAARGRGLARRLVAQAARWLHSQDIVPTYLHDPANIASARVADAAGFPDRRWTALGLAPIGEGS